MYVHKLQKLRRFIKCLKIQNYLKFNYNHNNPLQFVGKTDIKLETLHHSVEMS